MRTDESGVAGFFEDLPVLAFVLSGVMLLVSSGAWTSSQLAEQRADERLHELANRALASIIQEIGSLAPSDTPPMLQSIQQLDFLSLLRDSLGSVHFSVNLSALGQVQSWYKMANDENAGGVSNTASASCLLNAENESGSVLIVMVRVVVWET